MAADFNGRLGSDRLDPAGRHANWLLAGLLAAMQGAHCIFKKSLVVSVVLVEKYNAEHYWGICNGMDGITI